MLPKDSDEHAHCRSAIAALDHVLGEKPERRHDELAEGLRCLTTMRDHLIERHRAGAPDAAGKLEHVNAVLSVMHAGSFPMVGMQHERLKRARDLLARTLQEPPPA